MSKYKSPELKLNKIPTIYKEEYTNDYNACWNAYNELLAHPFLYAKKFETSTKRIKLYAYVLAHYATYLVSEKQESKNAFLAWAIQVQKELEKSLNNWPYISEGRHI